MQIEMRERSKKDRELSPWEIAEGAVGLTQEECEELVAEWVPEDKKCTPWLRIEYRIVEDTHTEQEELSPLSFDTLKFN